MRRVDGRLILSPSDLTGFLECEHLTQLELAVSRGELVRPKQEDRELEILRRYGGEHEEAYRARLVKEGRRVVEIASDTRTIAGLQRAEQSTLQSMMEAADVIYQATFFDGGWQGHADFLIKVPRASALGDWSYEVADSKLASRTKASTLLQLCVYAEQLTRLQGREPEYVHVIPRSGEIEAYRLADYAAYYRTVKERFLKTVSLDQVVDTYPEPVPHCQVCPWLPRCDAQRRADDHLSLVASISRTQRERLRQVGINTVQQLAATEVGSVQGVNDSVLERLRTQASLQVQYRESPDRIPLRLLPPAGPRLGFAALPSPSPGDLFFDMEGDPFIGQDGLEYLFGIAEFCDGQPRYHSFWAHDREAEKVAFESLVDLICDRLAKDPNLHVYHYALYEPRALKRLMGTYATRELEVDRLLRGGVLVDLYQVVRQSLRVGLESYGLKKLEPLYRSARQTTISDAEGSIVAYEEWLQTRDEAYLGEIGEYNRDDCVSTARLRDWLEARRREAEELYGAIERPVVAEGQPSEQLATAEVEVRRLSEKLTDGIPDAPERRSEQDQARWLLAQLLDWHRREARSEWWEYYKRLSLTDDELREDSESLAGITYVGIVGELKQSLVHRYAFDPEQEHKISEGDQPIDPRTEKTVGTVVKLDNLNGFLDVSRARNHEPLKPSALIPPRPIETKDLRRSLQCLAEVVLEGNLAAGGRARAALELLQRNEPAIRGQPQGSPLTTVRESAEAAARRLVMHLERSYLPIQGPPGTGKTRTGARMIVDLVRAGKRVGITATSHKVVSNLLDKAVEYAAEQHVHLRAIQKADEQQRCRSQSVECTGENSLVEARLHGGEVDVVAGTNFLFAREMMVGALDFLFIDEAGQMSLANALAIARSADNLVLLGDPNQLAQPTRGIHPDGAEVSALEHVLGDDVTMRPERGIFLDLTYRMHPSVSAYISEVFYEGRLSSAPVCSVQRLSAGEGLRFLPVVHEGDRTSSKDEAAVVARELTQLVGGEWVNQRGELGRISLDDILVVAPYNAQVKRLVETLPERSCVGTVDKFQGQEGVAVFYSMASSSAFEAPRGMEFLYSLNRLNVAISRARLRAAVVCSPQLLQPRCRTPQQMKLANALCRFAELALRSPLPAGAG